MKEYQIYVRDYDQIDVEYYKGGTRVFGVRFDVADFPADDFRAAFMAAVADFFDGEDLERIEIGRVEYADHGSEGLFETKDFSTVEDAMEWYGDICRELWDKNPHLCVNLFDGSLDEYRSYYSNDDLRDMVMRALS